MERQHLADGLTNFVGGGKTDANALPHAAALEFQTQLQKEQLFKDQPPVGSCRGALQLEQGRAFRRKMNFAQRAFAIGQGEPCQQLARQALRHRAAHGFQQVEDGLALPARGQPCAAQRLVYRRDAPHLKQPCFGIVAGIGQHLELRLNHLEIACRPRWLNLPVDGYRLPGVELALQIGCVEPDALQRQPALPHGQLEDRHFAGAQQDRAAHLRDDAGHLAGFQFVQAARVLAVLIAEGQVVEQILGGLDVLGGEHLRHPRTHAAHIHYRSIEAGHTQDAKWLMRKRATASRRESPHLGHTQDAKWLMRKRTNSRESGTLPG